MWVALQNSLNIVAVGLLLRHAFREERRRKEGEGR